MHPVLCTTSSAPQAATRGVVCDVDDTVGLTGLRHPLRAAWRTLGGRRSTRRPVTGMSELLGKLLEDQDHPPVVYLSNGPPGLAGPITRFLERHGFPPGTLRLTDRGTSRRTWFRDGTAHKRASLQGLARDFPDVRWVLVGDDGEHDPDLYRDFALDTRTASPPSS